MELTKEQLNSIAYEVADQIILGIGYYGCHVADYLDSNDFNEILEKAYLKIMKKELV